MKCRRHWLNCPSGSLASVFPTIVILLSCTASAYADGGAVQLSEVRGPYRVSVFTSPTPLRAGPVDISVLVQNASTGMVVVDAEVTIKLHPIDRPNELLVESANRANATNKILLAAAFDLPRPGSWETKLEIYSSLGKEEFDCRLEVGEPWPEWLGMLPWILWPLAPIAGFAIHILLVHRRRTAAPAGSITRP